jgi:peptidoglycan/LPS O-acetylase OafA/YrhL
VTQPPADRAASAGGPDGDIASIHSDRRLPALTGLRILAAIAVYFNHIGPPAGSPKALYCFLYAGYCGVTIFFVLSGFVLAYNYFEGMRHASLVSTYDFLVARFARVYPLYLIVLLFIVLTWHANGISVDGWWRNAIGIQAWHPEVTKAFSFDSPAWSVSVEFFLYACFPILIPLIARLRTPRSMLITAVVVAAVIAGLAAWFVAAGKGNLSFLDPSSAHRWLYRTPLTRLGDFTLGILAARLFLTVGHRERAIRIGRILTPLAIVAIIVFMAWPAMFLTAWSWDAAYSIPAACLLFGLAVAPKTLPARLLALSPMVLLGEASYAFYLIHEPALGFFGAAGWQTDASPTRFVYEAFVLGAILAFAVGLHVTIELPARRFLRRALSIRPGAPLRSVPGLPRSSR